MGSGCVNVMGGQIKLLWERRGLMLHYDHREALRFQDPLHTLRHIQPLYTPHHPQCTCVEELPPHARTHTHAGRLFIIAAGNSTRAHVS